MANMSKTQPATNTEALVLFTTERTDGTTKVNSHRTSTPLSDMAVIVKATPVKGIAVFESPRDVDPAFTYQADLEASP